MWASILFAVCCANLAGKVISGTTEEHQSSRYHYEALILERIIRAEIGLVAVKRDVTVLKKASEQNVKESVNDQSKLTEKVDILKQEFDDLVKNVSRINEEKNLLTTSSMRQFCTTDEACSTVKNSECKWMSCKCKPGLSYHHDTKTCLSDCGDYGYGNTYQVEIDALLYGFNTKTLTTISLEDCVRRCTTEQSFVCRTADYHKAKQICYLSWETLHTNPDDHKKNQDYISYTRACN